MPQSRGNWQRPAADEDSPTLAFSPGFDEHSTGKVRKPQGLLGPGQIVGDRYCIHKELAVGGMGRVYAAEDIALGRSVALKVLDPELTRKHPDFHRRFLSEAATCSAIKHPNIVSVYDYGRLHESSDAYFMAMEMVEGESLCATLRREGRLEWPRATRLAYETARALRAAHQAGAIHRDLKPSNIMVVATDDGESVKVLGFGLVQVLDAGETDRDSHMMGSPTYMAPEQIRRDKADARTDIHALGVILHVLLSGHAPCKGDTPEASMRAHLETSAPRLPTFVPAPVADIVLRCLQKDPDERWPDANALVTALAQAHAQTSQMQPLMVSLIPPSETSRPRTLTGPLLASAASRRRSSLPPPGLPTRPTRVSSPPAPASTLPPLPVPLRDRPAGQMRALPQPFAPVDSKHGTALHALPEPNVPRESTQGPPLRQPLSPLEPKRVATERALPPQEPLALLAPGSSAFARVPTAPTQDIVRPTQAVASVRPPPVMAPSVWRAPRSLLAWFLACIAAGSALGWLAGLLR